MLADASLGTGNSLPNHVYPFPFRSPIPTPANYSIVTVAFSTLATAEASQSRGTKHRGTPHGQAQVRRARSGRAAWSLLPATPDAAFQRAGVPLASSRPLLPWSLASRRPAAARGPRTPPRCYHGERVARGRRCRASRLLPAAAAAAQPLLPAALLPSALRRVSRHLRRGVWSGPAAQPTAGRARADEPATQVLGPRGRRHLCFPSGFDPGTKVSCLLGKSKGLRRKPVHISEVR